MRSKQAKLAEDLPPTQLPLDYVNKVVQEFYGINPRDEMVADVETPMKVNEVNVEGTSSGSKLSETNFVPSDET